MVVEPSETDPELNAMMAVEYPPESGVCHAVTSTYTEDGENIDATECGHTFGTKQLTRGGPREEYADKGLEMCSECWPDEIVTETT